MHLWDIKYLKSITETSVIECAEYITVMDIVSTKMTNTIVTNTMSTAWINCYEKVRDTTYNFISNHITIYNYYYL